MFYYVRDNYFEDWGMQGHPKYWKWGSQPDSAPRWLQFNNNGGELEQPASTPVIELVDAKEAYELVLKRAGCWPRDQVTLRTIDEVRAGTGKWGRNGPLDPADEWFLQGLSVTAPPKDLDRDGMPDDWELQHRLNPNDPSDANKVVLKGESKNDLHAGYSYIEFYLNELATR
jgi:hypothetical protein